MPKMPIASNLCVEANDIAPFLSLRSALIAMAPRASRSVQIVMSYGLLVFIRKTMGEDIAGACGQLVLQKTKEHEEKDIEDVMTGFEKSSKKAKSLNKAVRKSSPKKTADDTSKTTITDSNIDTRLIPIGVCAATGLLFVGLAVGKMIKRR